VPCDKRAPAVIWLHGSTTVAISPDPAAFAVRATGIGKQSETQGYLTVFPRSGRVQNDKVWAWNAGAGSSDVRFLATLVEQLVVSENVDPKRVFLAGHSSGAFLTYWMACQFSGLFAGYAAFSGALRTEWSCHPKAPIAFLEVHGRDDTAVPFEGSERFEPTMQTMMLLRDALGCDEKSSHAESPLRHDDTWSGCRNKAVVRLVTLPNAGHDAPLSLVRSDLWDFFTRRNVRK
jgi:polyhydroxybutyrate depolymerase